MPELSVVIVADDAAQRAILQVLVDGTSVGQAVLTCQTFPTSATDPIVRKIHAANPQIIVVDIPADNAIPALRTMELLQHEVPDSAIFAIGNLNQPQVIVGAMRAGAREFMERPTTTTDLLEAFVRHTATQKKTGNESPRGKVFTVVNAKGGSGATTIAVNLALALQAAHGGTALVDIAHLGHCGLHLNLKSNFTVADAVRNWHRLDSSLLESFMTRHNGGLQLLAGTTAPTGTEPSTSEFARLFDMLVSHYRFVAVVAPPRLDATTRLVANLSQSVLLVTQTDVNSLWSAARVQQFLAESGKRERIGLVLNRFRKMSGFTEADAASSVGIKLLWKVPNQFSVISTAIERGIPVMQQGGGEIAQGFHAFAAHLTENDVDVKRATWSLFKSV